MRFPYEFSAALAALTLAADAASKAPIPIAEVRRTEPVNFEREVLPFLSDNCFACHCQTTAKGGLNLESRELMLKGGDTGPALVPKQATESLLLQAAAHLDDDLAMPPRDNKAKAKNLTPEQLGLLKLWIDQGANVSPMSKRVIQWQPLPATLNAIFAVAVTADGQFAACTRENRICTYHLPSGQCVMNEAAHRDQVNALAFNPEGTLLASGGYREVKLWRRAASMQKASPRGAEFVLGAGLSASTTWEGPVKIGPLPGGASLTASADGALRLWADGKDQPIAQMNHGVAITAVAARPDGQRFVSAGVDKTAKLWDRDGKLIAELRGSRYAREAIEESNRAVQIAAGTLDFCKQAASEAEKQLAAARERVKKSGDAIAPRQQELESKQKALAEATEAKKFAEQAVATAEAELKKADEKLIALEAAARQSKDVLAALKSANPPAVDQKSSANKQDAQTPTSEEIAAAKAAAVKEAGEKAAAARSSLEQAASLAAAKAQEAAKAKTERDQREAQRTQAATKVEPAGKKVSEAVEAMEKARTARILADTEFQLAKAEEQKLAARLGKSKAAIDEAENARKRVGEALQAAQKAASDAEQPIRAVAFSPDNKMLATAGDDHCVHTWSADTGAPFDVFKGHSDAIKALAFTSANALDSTGSDGAVMVWNVRPEWKLERAIGASEGPSPLTDRVNALVFSREGKILATGSGEPSRGGEIKLWNPADGKLILDLPNIHSDAILGLDFSPDDKFLASGAADKMARVVDLATGKVVRSFEGHTHHILSVAWSMDGRTLVTAGADSMVKVWDFATGERKKNIEGYDKEVTAVHFAGASGNVVTSSGDNKVRLVSLEGKEVRAFPEVADFMQAAAVTADGRVVVAGGQDGVLRVWNGETGAKIAAFPPGE